MPALTIPLGSGVTTSARHYEAQGRSLSRLFVLAHGAGAGQDHPFLVGYASALAEHGVDVVTFNFPYIEAKRKVPDRAPVLEACFEAVIAAASVLPGAAGARLVIGGKSMGGRMATHLAARHLDGLRGVVALGYPLHPPGKPEQLRVAHLSQIAMPFLIVQGERDAFGTPSEIEAHLRAVPGPVQLHEIAGGDHSFAVRGRKPDDVRRDVVSTIVEWMTLRLP